MFTRLLLAVFIALTFVCGGIAIYYNRVFEGLQMSLADTKAQLAAAQARLKERQSEPPAAQSKPLPSSYPKGSR
jgi:hypothetical protein